MLFFDATTASELDNRRIFDARRIGRFSAFEAPGRSFAPAQEGFGLFRDDAGTVWDMLGNAVERGTGSQIQHCGAQRQPLQQRTR